MILLQVSFFLGSCSSTVKDNEIPPSFDFNYDNCVSVLDDPMHVYHTNDFIVTGCNALLEQAKEREMWERSNRKNNE